MLIVGIVFANFPFLSRILSIHQSWSNVIRQIALILCLIRCGIGIDSQVLKRSWVIFLFECLFILINFLGNLC